MELFRTLLMQKIEFSDRHSATALQSLISVELDSIRTFHSSSEPPPAAAAALLPLLRVLVRTRSRQLQLEDSGNVTPSHDGTCNNAASPAVPCLEPEWGASAIAAVQSSHAVSTSPTRLPCLLKRIPICAQPGA